MLTSKRGPRFIISGAPASGKGTQCEFIKKEFGVIHLSTGDMLRAAVQSESPIGIEAKKYMDSGQLVPDNVIIGIIIDRLNDLDCVKHGWLLDGFPRTRVQADALSNAGIECDVFIQIDVDESILIERVVGRRTDPTTGKIYHLKFSPPPFDDPALLRRLVRRSDDNDETAHIRLKTYNDHLDSIIDKYSGSIVRINGNNSPTEVWSDMFDAIIMKMSEKAKAQNKGPIEYGCLCLNIGPIFGYDERVY